MSLAHVITAALVVWLPVVSFAEGSGGGASSGGYRLTDDLDPILRRAEVLRVPADGPFAASYVYNKMWCSTVEGIKRSRSARLERPEGQRIKMFFKENGTMTLIHPSLKWSLSGPTDGELCMVRFTGTYQTVEHLVVISNLTAISREGDCSPEIDLAEYEMTAKPMARIRDESTGTSFLLLDIAGSCGTDTTGYQVLEEIPIY